MTRDEALKIKTELKSMCDAGRCVCNGPQGRQVSTFLEGYEAGVRASAEMVMYKTHVPGDMSANTGRCEHLDLRDAILALLEGEKGEGVTNG